MADHEEDQKIKLSKKMLANVMKEIDICMMTTVGSYGRLHSRPMSNNRNVDWDAETWFFASAVPARSKKLRASPM